ncbi:myc box-dependent-interacting protein 1b isoform X3 [Esox lucius]|uniref:myc box-dependent-interacting protein 1b isoform X3 n=1 Tax=Esox lucius TaxID=8010 RepID=UPI0014773347|nr:myc box-dependent-interacting protein 1b isoform X3 [Esox lucius]
MAEEQGKAGKGINTGKLATNMQKRLSRAQEKVLQKLGKADETKDTVFEESVANFNKQMVEGTKLQRDLRAYLAAVKTMHDASKRLQDCLADMYEPDWFGKEEVDAIAEEMIEKEMDYCMEETDILWSDYHDKLVDNSMVSMDTYLAQFPDVKARIAKRDRKLTDFDSARHHFASLQKGKKPDQAKIAKPMSIVEKAAPGWAQGILSAHQIAQTNLTRNQAEEELGRAQKVFEEINIELQDELPQLWNSRVGFYVNTFQSMAGYQERFHKDMGKLNQDLNDVMTKLEEQRLANEAAAANHSVTADAAPKMRPAPPAAPPVRPSPSPRPSLTPAPETQQDILLFDSEALVPDANTAAQATAPSQLQQFYAPTGVTNLLDMDLDVLLQAATTSAPQAVSWDSWEPEQPSAVEQPQQAPDGWEDEPAAKQGSLGHDGPAVAPDWAKEETRQAGWDQDAAQTGQHEPGWDNSLAQVGQEAAHATTDAQAVWADAGTQAGWGEQPADSGQTGWADSGQTGWADSGQTGWADSGQTGWADSGQTGWADSGQTGWADSGQTGWADSGQTGWADSGQTGWADSGQTGWADSGQTGWADSERSVSACGPGSTIEETDSVAVEPAGAAPTAVTNGSSEELPAGVIYKVKAMHDYAATDGDELELKAGDVVLVLAWDNPDEQDDGWLMGVKESHWLENKNLLVKGVFPENFTQKL